MIAPTSTLQAWDVFVPFGAVHAVTVVVCLLLVMMPTWIGRAARGTPVEPRLRRAFALAAALYWVAYNTWWNWNGLDVLGGLPLHFCDIVGLLAPLALLTGNRWLRAILYFWAFGFTTQAVLQPDLAVGPANLVFWAFWLAHTFILACASYDVAVLGFRPDWRDLGRAAVAVLGYAVVIIPLDLMLGANYGFIGNPPPEQKIPPMIESFGAWPGRLVILAGLTVLGFLLLLLPWLALAGRGRSRACPAKAADRG